MAKIVVILMMCVGVGHTIYLQDATPQQLMCLKGMSKAKVLDILEYRQTTKILNADELANIDGFKPKLIESIKLNAMKKNCDMFGNKIQKMKKSRRGYGYRRAKGYRSKAIKIKAPKVRVFKMKRN